MFKIAFPFKGFLRSELEFSSYPSGAMKIDLVDGDRLLAELTMDHMIEIENCVCFQPTGYMTKILRQMMSLDLVGVYSTYMDGDKFMYAAALNRRLFAEHVPVYKQMQKQKVYVW